MGCYHCRRSGSSACASMVGRCEPETGLLVGRCGCQGFASMVGACEPETGALVGRFGCHLSGVAPDGGRCVSLKRGFRSNSFGSHLAGVIVRGSPRWWAGVSYGAFPVEQALALPARLSSVRGVGGGPETVLLGWGRASPRWAVTIAGGAGRWWAVCEPETGLFGSNRLWLYLFRLSSVRASPRWAVTIAGGAGRWWAGEA